MNCTSSQRLEAVVLIIGVATLVAALLAGFFLGWKSSAMMLLTGVGWSCMLVWKCAREQRKSLERLLRMLKPPDSPGEEV